MNWLILNADQKTELDAINAQFTDRCVDARTTIDGIMLIPADLICNDVTWNPYQPLLTSLTPYSGDPIFAQTTE
jgi:hypothetical protein